MLLRGVAFRSGSRFSGSEWNHSSTEAQWHALRAVADLVISPAQRAGWHVLVADSTYVALEMEQAWLAATKAAWPVDTLRRHNSLLADTQVGTMISALDWVATYGIPWAALLLWRVDLILKQPLNVPAPGASGNVLVPFPEFGQVAADDAMELPMCHTVSDQIIWVPRAMQATFAEYLQSLYTREALTKRPEVPERMHLHMPVSYFIEGAWKPGTEGAPEANWNPLYDIIGRENAARPKTLPNRRCRVAHMGRTKDDVAVATKGGVAASPHK